MNLRASILFNSLNLWREKILEEMYGEMGLQPRREEERTLLSGKFWE
jgi:hypothetical protein